DAGDLVYYSWSCFGTILLSRSADRPCCAQSTTSDRRSRSLRSERDLKIVLRSALLAPPGRQARQESSYQLNRHGFGSESAKPRGSSLRASPARGTTFFDIWFCDGRCNLSRQREPVPSCYTG